MDVYKVNDVIQCDFLKIPKSIFANAKYRRLSSDAKLAYALLYDRLSLSKLNGWSNGRGEVYLIYTREKIAEDLGLTYKKAIAAFKELLGAELITEQRCGQGAPNKIYIVKPKISKEQAKDYAESELPNRHIRNRQNGISRTSETAVPDLPKSQSNQTDINQTKESHTEVSQSVAEANVAKHPAYFRHPEKLSDLDRPTDDIYSLDEIVERCGLNTFEKDEQKILYDAIERLFYSKTFRVGRAELPREKVRSRLYELDGTTLRSALANLHRNDKPVKNVTGYLCSTIFNCITEDYSLLHMDPYLNSLRNSGKG